ncbi:prepilin peptidase [Methanobrevibacter oralis]|uniref:Type IV leader peptidase family protein n=1 Tax=Methanobrevibacter oralis TaxID=66851 RepID=A0A165YWG0_METOA|nr:A24 family peptidase [Methanobrevibacter oralis]KZX09949.1 type IV leader peptidase family protein [Methanobrevibacter oralis]
MDFSVIFLIQIIITILFCLIAAIFDVRLSFIPDELNFSLLIFGLTSNLILSIFLNNSKFILCSFISMIITYAISLLLWKLNIWGGGDVKLLTAIATVIPIGIEIPTLNIYPLLSIYPFSFTVIINSILVSFPYLAIVFMHFNFKNDLFNRNIDLLVNIFNINSLILLLDMSFKKVVKVKDLKEGMIVDDFYFNNEHICFLIDDIKGNLKVYKTNGNSDFKYYFKSQTAGGITLKDVYLLKIMNSQNFISSEITVKMAFPFVPSILVGLLIAIFRGDLMMLFIKNLFVVI